MAFALLVPLIAALAVEPAPPVQQEAPEPGVWIGIALYEDDEPGLEITSVMPDSPAARSGLRAGDRLLVAGKRKLVSFGELMDELSGREPGSELELRIVRGLDIPLDAEHTIEGGRPLLGVTLGGEPSTRVTSVRRGLPGDRAGLREGDVLVAIGGEAIESYEDIGEAMAALSVDDHAAVVVRRKQVVTLGRRPGAATRVPQAKDPRVRVDPPTRRPRVLPFPTRRPGAAPEIDLHDELRELAAELKVLRREIAELRQKLETLRRKSER